MRDTSKIIPAVHPISGAPLGEPLTTWRVGRAHDAPRPITHVAVMRQQLVDDGHRSWVLWRAAQKRWLYRTVSAKPQPLPDGAAVVTVEEYRLLLAIAGQTRASLDSALLERTFAWWEELVCGFVLRAHPAGLSRAIIESYTETPALFDALAQDAPISLSYDAASEAAAMHMTSVELACSVRAEHGKWLVETGVGSKLAIHGSCATKHEAVIVAQAIRDRAWLTRLEEILFARGGVIGWGMPVVMPYPTAVYQ